MDMPLEDALRKSGKPKLVRISGMHVLREKPERIKPDRGTIHFASRRVVTRQALFKCRPAVQISRETKQ
jgi:hypothetical protein